MAMINGAQSRSVSAAARRFLSSNLGLQIAEQEQPARSGGLSDVINPADETLLARVPTGEREDVDLAVRAATSALASKAWAGMKGRARAKLLNRIADLIEENAALFAELECLDNGKPLLHALHGDVPAAAESFRYYAEWCVRIYGRTVDPAREGNFHAYTSREPVGVVGLIIPWNFPLLMACWKLAPALAAGCTCILKPAEETPLTALLLGRLIRDAGMPPGVVNVVTGYGFAAGAALAAHPGVDKVAFTGSTEVGKTILAAAAGNLKKVSLELGGKSPTIIFPDADVDAAIEAAAGSIFYNAGQICAAGSRLYAHASIFDQVIDGVCKYARRLRVGPGHQPETEMGPLVSARQRDRVAGYVSVARESGAVIVSGGDRTDSSCGYFYSPTVVTNVESTMPIVREEVFGPVLAAAPFASSEDLVATANDSIYGLTAKIWTRDLSLAHTLARQLKAGTISVNTNLGADLHLPFGGYKQSGWGRELGEEGLDLYLQMKTVIMGL